MQFIGPSTSPFYGTNLLVYRTTINETEPQAEIVAVAVFQWRFAIRLFARGVAENLQAKQWHLGPEFPNMNGAEDAAQHTSNKRRLSVGPDDDADANQTSQDQSNIPFKLTPPADAELFDYKSIILDNHEYKLRDNLAIESTGTEPHHGELLRIQATKNDRRNVYLTVRWFYRPDEIDGGKRPHHGHKELLRCVDHTDRVHVASVIGPSHIVHLVAGAESNLTGQGLYWREEYSAMKRQILTELPKYCLCKRPENPDLPLIQCDTCERWFHADDCVALSQTELPPEEVPWYCPECLKGVNGQSLVQQSKGPAPKLPTPGPAKVKATKKQTKK